MKTKLLLLAVGFASFSLAEKVVAQTSISTTFVEINPNALVYGSLDGSFFQDYPSGLSVFADFEAFCIEPSQGLEYGTTLVYDIQDPSELGPDSLAIAKLVGGYLASARTADDAAAVQWAIWEVVAETSSSQSLFEGSVIISPIDSTNPNGERIATLANAYLQNIDSFDPATLVYLTNPEYQDVVAWAIPEPATSGLLMLSSLMFFRRRR